MSYWKLAANAAWSGLYATLLLAVLLVLLNGVPGDRSALADSASAAASLAPVYLPAVTLALTTLFVFLRFFAVRRLSARWQSLKAIVWFGAATLAAMTAVTWLNLRWLGGLLSPAVKDALRASLAVMVASFLLCCLASSLAQSRTGPAARRLRLTGATCLAAPLACLLLLLHLLPRDVAGPAFGPDGKEAAEAPPVIPAATPWEAAGQDRWFVLLGVDAASMDHILPLVASGNLPAFDRMTRKGASSRLNTLRPCSSEAAWTALLTGQAPWKTGVRSGDVHALPFGPADLDLLPRGVGMAWLRRAGYVASTARRGPLWSDRGVWGAARRTGLRVDTSAWVGTAPLEDHDPRVQARVLRILGEAAAADGLRQADARLEPLRRGVAADLAARDAATAARAGRPGLLAVRLPGLAEVSRRYLRYHAPDEFGGVKEPGDEPLRRAMTGYYEFLDEMLGEILDAAGEDGYVLLVSPHGVEPVSALERALMQMEPGRRAGGAPVSGSWRRGPDGVFLLYGPGVQAGARPEEVDLLEVAPAAVYLMGLPVQRAMRGSLPRRVLRPDFLEAHPVHVVPDWDPPL